MSPVRELNGPAPGPTLLQVTYLSRRLRVFAGYTESSPPLNPRSAAPDTSISFHKRRH